MTNDNDGDEDNPTAPTPTHPYPREPPRPRHTPQGGRSTRGTQPPDSTQHVINDHRIRTPYSVYSIAHIMSYSYPASLAFLVKSTVYPYIPNPTNLPASAALSRAGTRCCNTLHARRGARSVMHSDRCRTHGSRVTPAVYQIFLLLWARHPHGNGIPPRGKLPHREPLELDHRPPTRRPPLRALRAFLGKPLQPAPCRWP